MLILNAIGQHIENDIMRWTCSDPSELPREDENLEIPPGSICKIIKDKKIVYYVYDSVAKEWFVKPEAAGGIDEGAIEDLKQEIQSVFQSLSSSKRKIAGAITEKGVNTLATDTFSVMAKNILDINVSKEEGLSLGDAMLILMSRNDTLRQELEGATTDEDRMNVLFKIFAIDKNFSESLYLQDNVKKIDEIKLQECLDIIFFELITIETPTDEISFKELIFSPDLVSNLEIELN